LVQRKRNVQLEEDMNFKHIFSLNYKQIIALVLLVVGIGFILYSVQQMDSFRETISMKVTGKYSKETMWYLISGILLVIFGGSGAVIFRDWKKKR
jgi:hypothetical protein